MPKSPYSDDEARAREIVLLSQEPDYPIDERVLFMYKHINPDFHARVVRLAELSVEYFESEKNGTSASFLHAIPTTTKQERDLKTAFLALLQHLKG